MFKWLKGVRRGGAFPGREAQSRLAKATVVIHRVADDSAADGPVFDLYAVRSFAEYVWHWLEDAGREFGVAVLTE